MKKLDIPDAAALKERADEEYQKSADALNLVRLYRSECNDLFEHIDATVSNKAYLNDVWLNANAYERRYLRDSRRHRRMGDLYMRRFERAMRKLVKSERVLINPELGNNILERYTPVEQVWIDYANDPENIFRETRDRIEEERPQKAPQGITGPVMGGTRA